MRVSEWLVVAYVAYLIAVAWLRPLSRARRWTVTAVGAGQALTVCTLAHAGRDPLIVFRDWLPALHLLVAYWLSGAFFVRPMPRVEAVLEAVDRRVFDWSGLGWLVRHGPRWWLESLELAYLGVYLTVPGGFALVWIGGAELAVDRYWTVVIGSGLLCYGMLPWLQTRPPTALGLDRDVEARRLRVRSLNRHILYQGSIRANTVPSGHAATAWAAALAAGWTVPGAWWILAAAACSISLAAVVARYHFALDVAVGGLLAGGLYLLVFARV